MDILIKDLLSEMQINTKLRDKHKEQLKDFQKLDWVLKH